MPLSEFSSNLEGFLTRIESVNSVLIDISRTKLYDEAVAMLHGIADDIQHSRFSTSARASVTPAEIGMANSMITTLRSQARILSSHADNGYGVTASLHGLVTGVRSNPSFGTIDPDINPSPGQTPID
ncbi:hypothetical protein N7481_004091 [Penicillium waksmanii]|uniref:uncharacterized protein n=1 Tax=Penicillium waksmanii TaxID=69791 RepID=UPI0025491448|nr:uncharacterized protein N7481_004091 [Penicillium waksmanii]KAJ5988881.1 hypothetical protein N7481_004091 [Penicillium waksmanii]